MLATETGTDAGLTGTSRSKSRLAQGAHSSPPGSGCLRALRPGGVPGRKPVEASELPEPPCFPEDAALRRSLGLAGLARARSGLRTERS